MAHVKALIKRDGPKEPTAIHGSLGLKYQPVEKDITFGIFEKISSHRMTCDENHKRRVEARVQTLLEAADETAFKKERACAIHKLI
jgi:hypothetical protein